ncbi:MAG: hypothetical protein MUO76_17275, partial [Anaerolineaceae bacterium]|nr:hypothetical protein [Anaerolineaceae bacterium]
CQFPADNERVTDAHRFWARQDTGSRRHFESDGYGDRHTGLYGAGTLAGRGGSPVRHLCLDGDLLISYIPDNAQRWISSPLHVGLSAGGEENTASFSGYIDEVLAGKSDETLIPDRMPLSSAEKLLQDIAVADIIKELSGVQPVEEDITTILMNDALWISSAYSLLDNKLWV